MNVLIIAVNVLVFLYETSLSREALAFFTARWGLTPAVLFGAGGAAPPAPFGVPGLGPGPGSGVSPWLTLVTSTFVHGGWTHIITNMLFLWVFGDNIEDRLGHFRYLFFYLAAGVAANLANALAAPTSDVPVIGASGAIAGVLGAYFLAFPRARITSLIFLGIFITIARVPAVIFLVIWFVLQLFMGLTTIGAPGQTVAWWAHIGGFAAGAVLYLILRRREQRAFP